jgi:hypothetical protein
MTFKHQYRKERGRGGGGEAVQITGDWPSGTGPGANYFAYVFCLSRLYHYLPIVQMKPFRQTTSHSATDSRSFQFSVNIFILSALAEGARKYFSPGLEPALGCPAQLLNSETLCALSNADK